MISERPNIEDFKVIHIDSVDHPEFAKLIEINTIICEMKKVLMKTPNPTNPFQNVLDPTHLPAHLDRIDFESEITKLIKSGETLFVIAIIKSTGEVVGLDVASPYFDPVAKMIGHKQSLFVLEKARRCGLAFKMTALLEQEIKKVGSKAVNSFSMASNEHSIKIMRKVGVEESIIQRNSIWAIIRDPLTGDDSVFSRLNEIIREKLTEFPEITEKYRVVWKKASEIKEKYDVSKISSESHIDLVHIQHKFGQEHLKEFLDVYEASEGTPMETSTFIGLIVNKDDEFTVQGLINVNTFMTVSLFIRDCYMNRVIIPRSEEEANGLCFFLMAFESFSREIGLGNKNLNGTAFLSNYYKHGSPGGAKIAEFFEEEPKLQELKSFESGNFRAGFKFFENESEAQ
jgi:hypothetical protein